MKHRTYEYSDELKDDFFGVTKETIRIPSDFKYVHTNIFWKACSFVVYSIIMRPFAYVYCKLKFRLKIVGGEKLKAQTGGYFLFSNHTLAAGDAFIPNIVTFPKKNYVITNADNVSTPGTKNYVLMCGALPLPTELRGLQNYYEALKKYYTDGRTITVYPEAHIWPYYTGIRNFASVSFNYPVKLDSPVYVSTTTFQRRKYTEVPRVTVYIDGPFYPDKDIPPRKAAEKLRDEVYYAMVRRAEMSTYSVNTYVKKTADTAISGKINTKAETEDKTCSR